MADGADSLAGVDGIVELAVPGGSESIAFDVALQPDDGKILLAGVVGTDLNSDNRSGDIAVARYNRDGSLDDGLDDGGLDDGGRPDSTPGDRFGSDGTVRTSLLLDGQHETASAVVVQLDGKIVAGGEADPSVPSTLGSGAFALVRYNRDGSLDDGGPDDSTPGDRFGADGTVTTDFDPGRSDSVSDLVLQPDGKIVAGGQSSISTASVFALARYNVDGTIDQSFGIIRYQDHGPSPRRWRQDGGARQAAQRQVPGGRAGDDG